MEDIGGGIRGDEENVYTQMVVEVWNSLHERVRKAEIRTTCKQDFSMSLMSSDLQQYEPC